jgi:Ca2+-binding EF-hand superfamily protein
MKCFALLILLFPAAVFAQGANMVGAPGANPRASLNERINQLDLNRDGQISRAEAVGYPKLSKGFLRIDKNKDGQLSSNELAAFQDNSKPRKAAKAPKVPKDTKAKKMQAASN